MLFSIALPTLAASIKAPFEKPWGNYLLDKIVENQSPMPISWLPQTIGWKLISVALFIFISNKAYKAIKQYQQNAYRREALLWLTQCRRSDNLEHYKQLPAILRKTALSAYHRSEISQLQGSVWERWLDQQCQQTSFANSCPSILHQLAYMPIDSKTFNPEHYQVLLTQITLWVKYHRGSE